MKGFEVFATMLYFGAIIMSLKAYNDSIISKSGTNYPSCATDQKLRMKWIGTAETWLLIEVLTFGYFLMTLIFLLIKSRFTKIGVD